MGIISCFLKITLVLLILPIIFSDKIKIYPNPATDIINIER